MLRAPLVHSPHKPSPALPGKALGALLSLQELAGTPPIPWGAAVTPTALLRALLCQKRTAESPKSLTKLYLWIFWGVLGVFWGGLGDPTCVLGLLGWNLGISGSI